ncbi:putative pumilio homolog 7, chloroplastic [Phragmites australis]|uniref:putative pumilio homolog 7, chloroplastic n=1 Tax=Phragmites australis TaxID=29695 RepID=UPI002D787B9D|nr:putative pumilio homolog 7, chloroplastic [Phragmites australis]
MMGARGAEGRTEEKEMDLLLSEIPHVTSPQRQRSVSAGVIGHGNGVHGAAGGHGYAAQRYGDEDANYAVVLNRRDDGGQVQGGGAVGGVGFHSPLPVGSATLQASSPFVGGAPSPLVQAVDDPEKQWLANQLRGLHIRDAPATDAQAALRRQGPPIPPVKNTAPADVPAAHSAYYGYNFGAPGSSVHHEHLFLDQAKAVGYVAARPQHYVSDVGLDGYGGFPRGLDTSMGGFVYKRVGNGTGTGSGQGLVHPDLAESYVLSGQAGAEHNWEFFSPSPIALEARGGPKVHYAYGVPVADNGFVRGGFSQFEAFRCDNSMMFDGKNINFLDRGRERRFQQYVNNRALELGNSKTLRYENMVGVKGYIYFMAKDQNGCRILQQKFEEGKHHVDVIFEGIIDHIGELMIDSFANYLVQKMLDVCDEKQRLRIIAVLTEDPLKLLRISLNTHGTRAVQKLIETVRSRKQILLIISALQPGFMHLVNDLNGNHVIQKCLTNFGAEENKFIFEAAATHCYDMAIHRHGCCVLQRCISSARGGYQAKLIAEICAHGFEHAQDPFGNYVVQYVLGLKIPSANAHLASQFEGRYVHLSKQKVSSNVVEKCLKFFSDDDKAVIVRELIKGSHFEQLLQDPYANYVIYTALLHTRGHLNNILVEAIHPHEEALRTSPCCKRISRALSRR